MTSTLRTAADQKEGVVSGVRQRPAAREGFSKPVPKPDRDSVDVRIMEGRLARPSTCT